MISHKHKFIFIHINKTGGTSVEIALEKYAEEFDLEEKSAPPPYVAKKHATIVQLMDEQKADPRPFYSSYLVSNYFKFTFVRNPWARSVSHYRHHAKTEETITKENPIGFKDWVVATLVERDPYYHHKPRLFIPQLHWIINKKGKVEMDYVGRFENFQEDFDNICDRIEIPRETLPHANRSDDFLQWPWRLPSVFQRKNYMEYYDNKTKEIVAEAFKEDIEYFGYEFGK